MIPKFKIGDTVKCISSTRRDWRRTPIWGGKYGHITGIVKNVKSTRGKYGYDVVWDNGCTNGSYFPSDLELVSVVPDELFEI